MTTPTTTDLRTMLDQATPGPWATQHDEWENDESIPCEVFSVIAGGDAILETTNFDPATHNPTANTTLAALAPDLAAEVIRLREAFERLIYEHEAEAGVARDQGNRVRERDLRTIANHLRALLGGERG